MAYDYNGQPQLTAEQKKIFTFVCPLCAWLNELEFRRICEEQTANIFKKRVMDFQKLCEQQTAKINLWANYFLEREFE